MARVGSWPGKEGQRGSHPNSGSTERVEGAASAVTFHNGEGAPVVGGDVRGVLQHGETARSEEGRSIEAVALIPMRGAAIQSPAPDGRSRWGSGVLAVAREGKGEAGKRAAATTRLTFKRGHGTTD
jgi:hypothetical protein